MNRFADLQRTTKGQPQAQCKLLVRFYADDRFRPEAADEPAPKEIVRTAGADVPSVLDRGLLVIVGAEGEIPRILRRYSLSWRRSVEIR